VWGTGGRGNVVWGTDCGGVDCDAVVWGVPDEDGYVWGSGRGNVVWGTGRGNVVWGTSEHDVTWGTHPDAVVFDAETGPLPDVAVEFGAEGRR
jgi:hypothetical protein